MRTHFLKDLKINGKEKALRLLPGFDFYSLHRLVRLEWKNQNSDVAQKVTSNLEMTIGYDAEAGEKAEITLRFEAVVRCKLPELSPMVYFSEIEVEDIEGAQLEGIRYIVKDYGTMELEIECKSFAIVECKGTK